MGRPIVSQVYCVGMRMTFVATNWRWWCFPARCPRENRVALVRILVSPIRWQGRHLRWPLIGAIDASCDYGVWNASCDCKMPAPWWMDAFAVYLVHQIAVTTWSIRFEWDWSTWQRRPYQPGCMRWLHIGRYYLLAANHRNRSYPAMWNRSTGSLERPSSVGDWTAPRPWSHSKSGSLHKSILAHWASAAGATDDIDCHCHCIRRIAGSHPSNWPWIWWRLRSHCNCATFSPLNHSRMRSFWCRPHCPCCCWYCCCCCHYRYHHHVFYFDSVFCGIQTSWRLTNPHPWPTNTAGQSVCQRGHTAGQQYGPIGYVVIFRHSLQFKWEKIYIYIMVHNTRWMENIIWRQRRGKRNACRVIYEI